MICKLGPVGCGCSALTDEGHCSVYLDEGVARNMEKGSCIFRNYRAEDYGIYKRKLSSMRNPLKAAKAAQRAATKA